MLSLAIVNSEQLRTAITGDDNVFQLLSVTGLDPVRALLNMANIYGVDGTKFVSSKLNNRNIVIMAQVNGNVETNRQLLYRRLPPKEPVRVEIATDSRSVTIDGYVEYIQCNIFERGVKAQISIICPDPYFRAAQTTSLAGNFTGTSGTIEYNSQGDAPAFFELHISAPGHTGFTLTAPSGDRLRVTTDAAGTFWIPDYSANGKNVYLQNNGTTVSVLENLDPTSVFFLLSPGQRQLSLSVPGASAVSWAMTFFDCFEGV